MKTLFFLAFLLIFSCSFSQTLVVNPQDADKEGGEIILKKSNESYNSWKIDNYAGSLRFHHSNASYFIMNSEGSIRLNNSLRVNNSLNIVKESMLPNEGSIIEGEWGNYILTNNTTSRNVRIGVSNNGYTRGEIEIENNNSPGADIIFKTSNSSGGTQQRMIVKSDGSIGIGTNTTGPHKLAVEGSIGAREVKIQASGWSDFVFENDYSLPTLEEVELHIQEKGHLKDIPSAKEVKENGVYLGEMDAKLLQKIEELMLYTIQQQKIIEYQEEAIKELRKEINQLKKQ
ncbi:hypothetical protein OOZ15_11785 [Galbibacter sp. EGI 63066]|uniref:hypothetical protein n=1 Tax=Galbibacter sp. EGI 63066 TaxID=2993559 RepID=UPI0022487F56|nr:hypothetical protein [Galbibacter sp. EGI 63066]MCX2680624.1 hypothetical protein [Galbibacter sp. EGI 63066]